ncbi:hypothetical protein ABZ897_61455 [Nonomuraea sp. NPDC046802]
MASPPTEDAADQRSDLQAAQFETKERSMTIEIKSVEEVETTGQSDMAC